MPYRDISLISIYGLRGLLYLEEAGTADGVSAQVEGPYEAKVVRGSWLRVYPEGQELQVHRASRIGITAAETHLGWMDVTVRIGFLTDSAQPARICTSPDTQAVMRIAAPPGTEFELVDCRGAVKDSRAWHSMEGSCRFYLLGQMNQAAGTTTSANG